MTRFAAWEGEGLVLAVPTVSGDIVFDIQCAAKHCAIVKVDVAQTPLPQNFFYSYNRHPRECEGPGFQHARQLKVWFPAYAGMTDLRWCLEPIEIVQRYSNFTRHDCTKRAMVFREKYRTGPKLGLGPQ